MCFAAVIHPCWLARANYLYWLPLSPDLLFSPYSSVGRFLRSRVAGQPLLSLSYSSFFPSVAFPPAQRFANDLLFPGLCLPGISLISVFLQGGTSLFALSTAPVHRACRLTVAFCLLRLPNFMWFALWNVRDKGGIFFFSSGAFSGRAIWLPRKVPQDCWGKEVTRGQDQGGH